MWGIGFAIIIYIPVIVLVWKNQKLINVLVKNRVVEIDENEIRIKSRKNRQEVISLNNLRKIKVNANYNYQSMITGLEQKMENRINQGSIIVYLKDQSQQFDFEINSFYMAKQLNRLVKTWIGKGYNVEHPLV
jgi:Tfp pilus assembly protein PilO